MSWTNKARKASLHKKYCNICKVLFKPTSSNQKYCGSYLKKTGCSYEVRKTKHKGYFEKWKPKYCKKCKQKIPRGDGKRICNKCREKERIEYEKRKKKREKRRKQRVKELKKKTEPIKGFIYLLKSKNLYKIGRAKNPKSRIRTYRTENPFGIKVILQKKVDDYIKVENMLLKKFKEKLVNGKEWFKLNNKDIKEIENILL